MTVDDSSLRASGLRTIEIEQQAISELHHKIDETFIQACRLLLDCEGRIVVTGMGKSGHIARKVAATLSSTGSPAFYLHPGEASHGDLGMITEKDVVLALSNSGTTAEIVSILPSIKRKGTPLISLTGDPRSPMAQAATVSLDAGVTVEACPLGLAPTTSTTVALVLGDALAMALLEAKGFTREEFAFSHPGGNLGRRLLLKVRDIMHSGKEIPQVEKDTLLSDALLVITSKSLGMTTVQDNQGNLLGVFTDGDLRRTLDSGRDIHKTRISEVMSTHYKSIRASALATEAVKLMQENEIYTLITVDENDRLNGVIRMHDLLQAGVV